ELARRVGVGHDPGAGAEARTRAFDLRAADQDVEVEVAVPVQPAHRAGVGAAPGALEFGDDLHAADLRAPGDRAAREHGGDHLAGIRVAAQPAPYVADDVVDMGVALDRHQFVDLDAARYADAPEVVSLQVDQPHVLGALLGGAAQLALAGTVLLAGNPR